MQTCDKNPAGCAQ